MKKLLLGFAGEMAAGKGTATEFVKSLYPDTPSFRFSDTLREFWGWWRVYLISQYDSTLPEKATTKDLQELSTTFRGLFGEDTMERATILRARRSNSTSPVIIIEGIRRLVDISALIVDERQQFRLIYVKAPPVVRWERHRLRNEKPGDSDLTYGQFLELGQAEPEQEIGKLQPYAHLVVDNSGELSALEAVLKREIANWLDQELSPPKSRVPEKTPVLDKKKKVRK